MSHSPLSMRCEIVKGIVETEFSTLPEFERRRMETTILQMLAPIYAPPRSATPIAADVVFRVALDAKNRIDERERTYKLENNPQLVRPVPRRPSNMLGPIVLFE